MEPDRLLLRLGGLGSLAHWFFAPHQGLPHLGVERGDTLAELTEIPAEEASRALRAAGINPKRSRWGRLGDRHSDPHFTRVGAVCSLLAHANADE